MVDVAAVDQMRDQSFAFKFDDVDVFISSGFPTKATDILLSFESEIVSTQRTETILKACTAELDVWQAFVEGGEYYRWQSADNPDQYMWAKRPLPDLPTYSNNFPPLMDKMLFDVSGNPGHRSTRVYRHEIPTSVLWASDSWLAEMSADVDALRALTIEPVHEVAPGVRRYVFYSEPFSSSEGEQAALQWKIRTALFAYAPE